jgi:hypothetical protein
MLSAFGTSLHHGFFPTILRSCISQSLCENESSPDFPEEYSTVIFSMLQLIVSYQNGCSSLVDAGLCDILLMLVKSSNRPKFVTRAIRILDHLFGFYRPSRVMLAEAAILDIFVQRIQKEVNSSLTSCRRSLVGTLNQDIVVVTDLLDEMVSKAVANVDSVSGESSASSSMDVTADAVIPQPVVPTNGAALCPPERKSLIKGLLRLLISISAEPTSMTSIRNIVEGSFPQTLEVMIRSPLYFGTSIWTLVCKWVTNFLNAEPNMLNVIQESGVSSAFFDVLGSKIPASAEVLMDLPNLLASLCLNVRGLATFAKVNPIENLLPIFLMPEYLPCLNGDAATHLGASIEELFRHQPTLRASGLKCISDLVDKLVQIGNDASITVVIGKFCYLMQYENIVIVGYHL